ncbi:MAG: nicotinate-nucleotide adenylyltransferase [Verrucomicrobiota bacterium]
MRKIGIYGGTFDPIHHGHLILAREAFETLEFEKVIFVPAAVSPLKASPTASAQIRLSMLRAAIEAETGFALDDCELRRPPPSYAIDTVEEIRQRETNTEIHYLIGEDNVAALASWHRFNELEKMVRFVVLDRTGMEIKHDYAVIHRKIDISATDIRNRVASGQSIRYLVPAEVEKIIRQENIYREKQR